MFYNWVCWLSEACAKTGLAADIDMASFFLRLKLWVMKKSKRVVSLDEAFLYRGKEEAADVIRNFNKRTV